ncbi:MAG TPA: cation:proton antiporter [Chryseolinea sp.]|nr:cation:proton antiporter [Chryseolinea sp.]
MTDFLERLLEEFKRPFQNSVLIFAVILFIILLAPIILKRVRIPGIIGLIISGVVIGPHGLFLLEKNAAVDLFSTIGLLYIMFIAGLELDLGEFNKNKNKSLVFGFLTFIIPISLGVPVCLYLLHYSMSTSFLTASMFATHTLIAYPIVSRLGISKNEAVAITVGGTILTDTAVLLILAAISGAEKGGLTSELWIRLAASLAIFIGIVAFIIPRIASWFFKRFEDEKNAHFIFVLSVVFFCAFIAELSGLEPIIGAFAAGLTLNHLIPHSSSLMNRIEFVGNSLFIPFFLISVGMLIDVKVLSHGTSALVVAGALTTVALCGKWAAATLTGLIFKFSNAQKNLIFGLSSAHAAATLAVILVGYKLGIIDDAILNGTIILILITCLVASFVTEDAGKKVVLQSESEETQELNVKAQRILVPVSNPDTMEKLIDFAITIKEPKNVAPIIGLTVVEDDDLAQSKLLQARKMLDKAIVHAVAAEQKVEIMATIDQNVSSGIQRVSKEMFITDIVLGWSAKNKLSTILFGKAFDGLINQTDQTVFLTRFQLPLNVHHHVQLICPPFVERDAGFQRWLSRTLRLAGQLSMGISVYSNAQTYADIVSHVTQSKVAVSLRHIDLKNPADVTREIIIPQPSDMIVWVLSRKGNVSHSPYFHTLPGKMVKAFQGNSLVFIYPESRMTEGAYDYALETENNLLGKGITLLKGAKGLFTKN